MNTQHFERNYSLDFLKIIATILIIFHHYQQMFGVYFENSINFFGDWFYWGYLVEFFFILSGYFMYRYIKTIKENPITLSSWYIKRAKRLLPMTAITVISYEIMLFVHQRVYGFAYYNESINIWGTLISCLGIQEGGAFLNPAINNPIWYISVLLICYVVFYIAIRLSEKLGCSHYYLFIALILLGCSVKTFDISLPFLNYQVSRGYYSFFFGLLLAGFTKT